MNYFIIDWACPDMMKITHIEVLNFHTIFYPVNQLLEVILDFGLADFTGLYLHCLIELMISVFQYIPEIRLLNDLIQSG